MEVTKRCARHVVGKEAHYIRRSATYQERKCWLAEPEPMAPGLGGEPTCRQKVLG